MAGKGRCQDVRTYLKPAQKYLVLKSPLFGLLPYTPKSHILSGTFLFFFFSTLLRYDKYNCKVFEHDDLIYTIQSPLTESVKTSFSSHIYSFVYFCEKNLSSTLSRFQLNNTVFLELFLNLNGMCG